MPEPSLERIMERWDPYAARWRPVGACAATDKPLRGCWPAGRGAGWLRYLQRSLGMPLADAEDVVARVRG